MNGVMCSTATCHNCPITGGLLPPPPSTALECVQGRVRVDSDQQRRNAPDTGIVGLKAAGRLSMKSRMANPKSPLTTELRDARLRVWGLRLVFCKRVRTGVTVGTALYLLLHVASAAAWPTWGNNQIADCTFAAAANWELAALGYRASEQRVEHEFLDAGGSPQDGISRLRFESWWRRHGIGGVRAQMREVPADNLWHLGSWRRGQFVPLPHLAQRRLETLLRRAHFLLAGLIWNLGHEVLIVGADRHGVTFVTWGEEQTMSWEEWVETVTGVYVVSVRGGDGHLPSTESHSDQRRNRRKRLHM